MSTPKELSKKLLGNILSDMKVELTEEFDNNFERKSFFTERWKPRKMEGRGTLLVVTGGMRRSIRPAIKGTTLVYTSPYPYTAVHNEGGTLSVGVRAHTRTTRTGNTCNVKAHNRRMNVPKRQFIGDHPRVRECVKNIIDDNLQEFSQELNKILKP